MGSRRDWTRLATGPFNVRARVASHRSVLFIKWCWAREKKREEYAKAKNFDRNRLTWQKQLMTYLITDYNLDRKKAERA